MRHVRRGGARRRRARRSVGARAAAPVVSAARAEAEPLRLACQCTVRGDVVVSKFEGFWGARPTLAPSAVAKTYFGEPLE